MSYYVDSSGKAKKVLSVVFCKEIEVDYYVGVATYEANDSFVVPTNIAVYNSYFPILDNTKTEIVELEGNSVVINQGEENAEIKSVKVSKIESYSSDNVLLGTINLPNAPITLNGVNSVKDTLTFEEQENGTYNAIITRRIGVVDLGTLNWNYVSGRQIFVYTDLQNLLIKPSSNSQTNYSQLIDSYGYYLNRQSQSDQLINNPKDISVSISSNGNLQLRNLAYTDATAFKTAMSGVMLYYELATPTTEVIATGLTHEQVSMAFEKGGSIINDNTNTNIVNSNMTMAFAVRRYKTEE